MPAPLHPWAPAQRTTAHPSRAARLSPPPALRAVSKAPPSNAAQQSQMPFQSKQSAVAASDPNPPHSTPRAAQPQPDQAPHHTLDHAASSRQTKLQSLQSAPV